MEASRSSKAWAHIRSLGALSHLIRERMLLRSNRDSRANLHAIQAEQFGDLYCRPTGGVGCDDDMIINDSKVEMHNHYHSAERSLGWLWKPILTATLLSGGLGIPAYWWWTRPIAPKPIDPATKVLRGDADIKVGEPYVIERND